MIEEDNLGVLVTFNLLPSSAVTWVFQLGVDVDNLSVSLVSEQESGI